MQQLAESFFYTLKTELVYHNQYPTGEEARLVIFDYIAAFYNRTRRHSSIGYRSPDDHKAQYALPSLDVHFSGATSVSCKRW